MRLRCRVLAPVLAVPLVFLLGCSTWTHLRSPENAKPDPWMVWISVVKGFSGAVYYVGSKEPYAYFRIDAVFPSYYKTPSCNTTLPRTFDVGRGKPYLVTMDNVHNYNSSLTCEVNETDAPTQPQGKP
jgi:hypothetical protein